MKKLLIVALALGLAGCTENARSRSLGGTMRVDLPCGEKLFDLTWKEDSFWYATRHMRKDEVPETYTFREKSGFGAFEGKVIIRECR